jgi:hypothetical protein
MAADVTVRIPTIGNGTDLRCSGNRAVCIGPGQVRQKEFSGQAFR